MNAVRFHEHGPPEVLRYEEIEEPTPGDGEAIVRVRAAGVNRFDLDLRSGRSRMPLSLPHIEGFEAAGEVVGVGSSVEVPLGASVIPITSMPCGICERCTGDAEVLCQRRRLLGVTLPGAYAEYVVVPAASLLPMPESLSYEQATSVQTSYSAVWHALTVRAPVNRGDTVLVNGAGGGVGSAAIQIAKLLGARVIASAGGEDKLERALELGADEAVNYAAGPLDHAVRKVTDGQGVDIVMESVGGEILSQSLAALVPGGKVVTIGAHAGEMVAVDVISLFRQELSLIGSVHATVEEIRHVIRLAGEGKLRPILHETLALRDAPAAHRLLESRRQFGKIVLVP